MMMMMMMAILKFFLNICNLLTVLSLRRHFCFLFEHAVL